MKKTIVTMAAMLLMAGAAFAQAPEQEAPAKQETAAPAQEEPAKEEKAETDGEDKGDCTKEKCQGADSSSTDAEAKPAE